MTNETSLKSTKDLTRKQRVTLYRSVPCPTCGRGKWLACRKVGPSYQHGAYDLETEHNERIIAARAANGYTK